MKTLYGLTMRDWDILKRMLNTDSTKKPETVAEYIARTGAKTETRTSKRGTKMVKVFYENGLVKEYEEENISRTTAFSV